MAPVDVMPPLMQGGSMPQAVRIDSDDDVPPEYGADNGYLTPGGSSDDDDDELPPLDAADLATRPFQGGVPGRGPAAYTAREVERDSDTDSAPPLVPNGREVPASWSRGPCPPPDYDGLSASAREEAAAAPPPAHPPRPMEASHEDNFPAKAEDTQHSAPKLAPRQEEELRAAKLRLQSCTRAGDKQKVAAMLLELSEVQIRFGCFEEALQGAMEARRVHKELLDPSGEARALRTAVKVHWTCERFSEALHLAEVELDIFRQQNERAAEGYMLLATADVHHAQDNNSFECSSAEYALGVFRQAGHDRGEAAALKACMEAYAASGRWMKAQDVAEEAEKKNEAVGDVAGQADVLRLRALARLKYGVVRAEDAHSDGRRALALYEELGDRPGQASAQEAIAKALMEMEDGGRDALKAVNKALAISREDADTRGELSACILLAQLRIASEMPQEAIRAQKIALRLARERGDQKRIDYMMDMGIEVHAGDNESDKAMSLVEEELRLARSTAAPNPKREGNAMTRLAKVKLMLGNQHESLRTIGEAVTLLLDAGEKRAAAAAQLFKAQVLVEMQRAQEALGAAKEAEALYQGLVDTRGVQSALQVLAETCIECGREESALQHFKQQVRVFKDVGWKEEEAGSQVRLVDVLHAMKGPREALRAAKEARQMYKDLGHLWGEAISVLQVAVCQVNCQAPTDALRSANEARAKAKEAGDFEKEILAIEVAMEVYMTQGSVSEALRMVNETVKVALAEDNRRLIAEQSKKAAEIYLRAMRLMRDSGRGPSASHVTEALKLAEAAREGFVDVADRFGEAAAWRIISGVHTVSRDGEKGVEKAHMALQICAELEDSVGMGNGYVALARAYVQLGRADEALESAHEAQTCFKQRGDDVGEEGDDRDLDGCDDVIRQAQEFTKPPPPKRSQSMGRPRYPESDPSASDSSTAAPRTLGRARSVPVEEKVRSQGFRRDEEDVQEQPTPSASRRRPGPPIDDKVLPASLNNLKGPEANAISKEAETAIREAMIPSPEDEEEPGFDAWVLGFGRGRGRRLGFGPSDDAQEAQGGHGGGGGGGGGTGQRAVLEPGTGQGAVPEPGREPERGNRWQRSEQPRPARQTPLRNIEGLD